MIGRVYRYVRDSRGLNNNPKLSKMGFKFLGNQEMQNGVFEVLETRIVERILSKVDTFVNVGANIGYYTCIALRNKKRVIAFEPIDLNLKYLLKNVEANGWSEGCEIFPLALSNKVGIIEIFGGGTGASLIKGWAGTPEWYSTLVPCSTMDIVLGSRLHEEKTLIVVDVEGAESMMLEGATKILGMNPKPIWMIEIACGEHQPNTIKVNPKLLDTFEKFWMNGYVCITASDELRPVCRDEIIEIMKTQIDTLGTHNFIFYDGNSDTLFG